MRLFAIAGLCALTTYACGGSENGNTSAGGAAGQSGGGGSGDAQGGTAGPSSGTGGSDSHAGGVGATGGVAGAKSSSGGASEMGGAGGDSADGHALLLDGIDDYVKLPAAAGAANEAAFSSELWFKTSAPTGMLLEVYSTVQTGADRSLYLRTGKVCFYVYAPSYSELCTQAGTFGDAAWHHAAGTLGPSGQLLYVDGSLEGSVATVTASAFNFDTGFRAGYGYIGPNGPLTYFAGELDEIRIWSTQRSAADVAANMGQSIDPATSGLQGYWKLDESAETTIALDATAGGHDGMLLNLSFTPSPWVSPGAF